MLKSWFAAVVCTALGLVAQQSIPLVSADQWDERVDAIMATFTEEDIIGQMTQIDINQLLTDDNKIDEDKVRAYAKMRVGSYLTSPFMNGPVNGTYMWTAEEWRERITKIQEITMEENGGHPMVYGVDSVHGAIFVKGAVLFGQQINGGASFNPDLVYEQGRITGRDTESSGVPWVFGPILGISRNPLWPRTFETEVTFSMWIPAKDLTSTFTDTEIMTSLGSGPQPAILSANTLHLRDFKTVRNAGISFVCTNRDVCSKLGGQQLTICGKKFRIQPYSKYSNWYYVDLQRLPDETTDGEIYDWFAEHGTPPVYISRATAPASLMIDPTTPLRQVDFGGHGYVVVNHRIPAFNRTKPPFLQALQVERKARSAKQPAAKSRSKQEDSPPIAAPNGNATMDVDNDSDYAPSESNHSDESLKDASEGSDMEDVTMVSASSEPWVAKLRLRSVR
ncbi:hypothetical protein ON010_g4340 [Phytophthora cinnamomi]|nr:hypothetical protein ON010_g4340 [Phytophthora cinnamomi]